MSAQLKIGNFVVQSKRQYEIQQISQNGEIVLEDTFTKAKITLTRRELTDSIFIGTAEVISSDSRYNELHDDNAQDFHSYSDELKAVARKRFLFVNAFKDEKIKGCSEHTLTPLIDKVCARNETTHISWRTLKRWIDAYDDYGIKGLIPKTNRKGNRKSRKQNKVEVLILEALEKFKNSKRPTFKTAFQSLYDDILLHNHALGSSGQEPSADQHLDTISYQGFINRAKKIAPVDLLEAYLGKKKVINKFRVARKPDAAQYILDRAEIDHTGGDCFVVDDVTRLPLGRPTVTAILDKKSKSILGIYIGFEAPSFVSVGRAMKHAISDKTDFLKRFPAVEGDWPCRGAFTEIAYDRGAEFESVLLEDALWELQIIGRGNPAGMPWYKGAVESFFKTVNQTFLDDKPGKVFSNLFDSNEYDPEKNAVISLSEFLEAFYVWVVDIYMKSPHGADEIVPYVAWKLDERYIDIEPISPKKLELMFSENTNAQNRDDGLVYETIKYDNDLLLRWRKQYGKRKLTFKVNRENLSSIEVLNPKDNKYYTVKAVDQEYAQNLTYYQHKVCRKYRKQLTKESVDEVSLAQARKRIVDIINQSFKSTKKAKLAHSKVASRFQGLGQDTMNQNTLIAGVKNPEKPSSINVPKEEVKPKESVTEFVEQFEKPK
jgi:putative transposase